MCVWDTQLLNVLFSDMPTCRNGYRARGNVSGEWIIGGWSCSGGGGGGGGGWGGGGGGGGGGRENMSPFVLRMSRPPKTPIVIALVLSR